MSREESEFAFILTQKEEDSLASAVSRGRIAHRLVHCVGGDVDVPESLPNHFMGLLKATFVRREPFDSWDQWRESVLRRYSDDGGLKLLIKRS